MPRMVGTGLSRREREILDVLYKNPKASASTVQAQLAAPPSYSAVRSTLRILEEKGYARHVEEGKKYLYVPVTSQRTAARSAIKQVIHTFFGGNLQDAVKAFLSGKDARLSDQELNELIDTIQKAKNDEGDK
jgi:BlaI family transcriptional regulator, penicillinase repressor